MPQIVLRCTANIPEKNNLRPLLATIQDVLVEDLPTQLHNCKSHVDLVEQFYIGDSDSQNAFVHLEIKILPGRTQGTLKTVAEKLLAILKQFFRESSEHLNLQIGVEMNELQNVYLKWSR